MKKFIKKHGVVRIVSSLTGLIGIILFIIAAFLKSDTTAMILNVIGFYIFLISGFVFFLKSKDHQIFKLLTFLAFVVILMSWLMSFGVFQGLDFYDQGIHRIGFGDLGHTLWATLSWIVDKVIYLLVLAGFYSILSKLPSYKALVSFLAKKFKKHEIITAVVISLFIVLLTSFLDQTIVVLTFIPFLVAILLNMKIDKLTTFAITFGSILIGLLGPIYGSDGLLLFNRFLGTKITTGIFYRLIILLVAFFLYNFFICFRLKKVLKEKNDEDITDVAYIVTGDSKKAKKYPMVILFSILLILIVLGFVNWEANFNVLCFQKFHKWLTGLSIGKDFPIFAYLLGNPSVNAQARMFGRFEFGTFDLISISLILLVIIAIISLVKKIKITEFIETFTDGIKKMLVPISCVIGAYFIFSLCNNSAPFMSSITNWSLNLVNGFNPYITSILALVTNFFHVEAGFTAYIVGPFLAQAYADSLSIVHTLYLTMFGLGQLFMPTSIIMLIGLKLMNVDYKAWLKYIGLFAVSMFIILLVFFTVLVYI